MEEANKVLIEKSVEKAICEEKARGKKEGERLINDLKKKHQEKAICEEKARGKKEGE